MHGALDHGAFRTRVIAPAANVVPLPEGMGLVDVSLLPVAVVTAWLGWGSIGLAHVMVYAAADKGYLVWGGAFGVWLKEKLEKGIFVPSPGIRMVEGGLASVSKGLDELKMGVSGVKFVLKV